MMIFHLEIQFFLYKNRERLDFDFTEIFKNGGKFAKLPHCAHYATLWKNEKITLTQEIFRQINYLVILFVKPLF